MEPIKLSLQRKEVPVTLLGEGGVEKAYVLREMSGAQREAYHQLSIKRVRFDPKGKATGVKDFEGMHAELLAFCFFDQEGKAVPREEIQSLPQSAQVQLFNAAQQLNGLVSRKEEPDDSEGGPKNED